MHNEGILKTIQLSEEKFFHIENRNKHYMDFWETLIAGVRDYADVDVGFLILN